MRCHPQVYTVLCMFRWDIFHAHHPAGIILFCSLKNWANIPSTEVLHNRPSLCLASQASHGSLPIPVLVLGSVSAPVWRRVRSAGVWPRERGQWMSSEGLCCCQKATHMNFPTATATKATVLPRKRDQSTCLRWFVVRCTILIYP